jgi:hypothetical protein
MNEQRAVLQKRENWAMTVPMRSPAWRYCQDDDGTLLSRSLDRTFRFRGLQGGQIHRDGFGIPIAET